MGLPAKLVLLCGKMAAGKSTLARALAQKESAVLLVQDELLDKLYPGEIAVLADYARCSARLNDALAPHIRALLEKGVSVVLDFPGNTKTQRAWFRSLIEATNAAHELHFIDVPDDACKRQLKERTKDLQPGTPWTTEAEFDAVTAYFQPPSADEGFNVIHTRRT